MDSESHAGSWHNPYQDLHLLQMLPAMVFLKANICMGHKILSRVDTSSSPVTKFCPCSSGKIIKGGGGGGGGSSTFARLFSSVTYLKECEHS